MNKKAINIDNIIKGSERYRNDEFLEEEFLEEESIDDNFSYDYRINEEELGDDFYYTNDSFNDQDEEELILNLINSGDEDNDCYCYENHHEKNTCENERSCSESVDNDDENYYTECNYSCGCSDNYSPNLEDSCEDQEDIQNDECGCDDDKDQGVYDEGFENGFTAGYEKAKQEVIDYINERKRRERKRRNRSSKRCCRCCCCCRHN